MTEVAGFLSYVREDDEHENGRITALRRLLEGEIRMQTGQKFPIFQDKDDIFVGQQWRRRIEESIDGSTLLIVVITPSLFLSEMCRAEVTHFLERERVLGRDDLVIPLLYMETPALFEDRDELSVELVGRQYFDLRPTRFDAVDSPGVRREVSNLAAHVTAALKRSASNPRSIEPKSVGLGPAEGDEGPGFPELSVAAEKAMPQFTATIDTLASEMTRIAEMLTEGKAEVDAADARGRRAAGGMFAMQRLSKRLEDPTTKIERLVEEYGDQLGRVDPEMGAMAIQVAGLTDENDLEAARRLLDAVSGLSDAASEGFETLDGFLVVVREGEAASSTLRPMLRRVITAFRQMRESHQVFSRWRRDLGSAVATAETRSGSPT